MTPFADTITPALLRLLPSLVTKVEIKLHVTPRGQDITYSALNRAAREPQHDRNRYHSGDSK